MPDRCTEKTDGVETPSSIKKYVWESADCNEIIWLTVLNGGPWLPAYFDGKVTDPTTFGMKEFVAAGEQSRRAGVLYS